MHKKNLQKIKCPICFSENNSLWVVKDGFDIYRCGACNTAFVFPVPGNLSDIYNKDYFNKSTENKGFGYTNYDLDKYPMRGNFLSFLDFISERININKKVFDVGAATGFFLDIAKENGFETAGIEISDYAAQEASRRGHSVFSGNFLDITTDQKYPLVTMWDVIEHVDNPRAYVKKAYSILEPGSYLAINTIDLDSVWARFFGKKWHLIVPPEHLTYFTKNSLIFLLEAEGFEIIKFSRPTKKFSLAYIFKMLYKWQKFSFWRYLSRFFEKGFWRHIKIPINLGDNMLLVAKKK